ncbi:hypothetical protein PENSPDRAFT_573711, partial [Peniophora sp. CONT]
WIKGPSGELLLWVPEDLRPFVQHPPCELVIGESRVTIDWSNAVHGSEWARCYAPHVQSRS